MKIYFCFQIIAASMILSSCQTTGDPSTGGIFWSEKKAQQRLQDRQTELNAVEQKTREQQQAARLREQKIRALQP